MSPSRGVFAARASWPSAFAKSWRTPRPRSSDDRARQEQFRDFLHGPTAGLCPNRSPADALCHRGAKEQAHDAPGGRHARRHDALDEALNDVLIGFHASEGLQEALKLDDPIFDRHHFRGAPDASAKHLLVEDVQKTFVQGANLGITVKARRNECLEGLPKDLKQVHHGVLPVRMAFASLAQGCEDGAATVWQGSEDVPFGFNEALEDLAEFHARQRSVR